MEVSEGQLLIHRSSSSGPMITVWMKNDFQNCFRPDNLTADVGPKIFSFGKACMLLHSRRTLFGEEADYIYRTNNTMQLDSTYTQHVQSGKRDIVWNNRTLYIYQILS